MSTIQEERMENALQSLLQKLVPAATAPNTGQDDDDDEEEFNEEEEEAADRRWDETNDLAHAILAERSRLPSDSAAIAEDVNHAADLIKRRFIRDLASPEKATRFGNLYSRLLSQPILNQKWGILYFLYRLADGGADAGAGAAGYDGDNPLFNEAFSRNGLPRISQAVSPDRDVRSPSFPRDRPVASGRPHASAQHSPQPAVSPARSDSQQDRSKVAGPPEQALLRDLPFTLQGLSSTNLSFTSRDSLKLPTGLPVPMIALLHSLAEPSLLYKSLAEFVESSEGGLVGQSLRSAISLELRSYLGLVATLEGQIRRAISQIEENADEGGLGKAGVTLKRCVVWTREATLGLRLMSTIVESAKGKKGGELISLIHGFSSSHGDPFVHAFAERLLGHVTKPFYNMLRAWIYDGELEDPFREFFVYESQDYEDSGATSVWEHKYQINKTMIPSIIDEDFANRVFLIGKSLNFIRYGCGDGGWVEKYSKQASKQLTYGDTATLSRSIDEAYKTVMARLISLVEGKFALLSHLQALKKYLLLGAGDFIALLMESLAANLDRPANSQYRHTLTAQLEHAIRNSNAQHDPPDVLRRLDARMLELSHGEIGWDVFTLEYRIDSPLDVIITPWASKQYLKVFNFLWRVKRVEFALGSTWRRCMTGARGVLAHVGGSDNDTTAADWKGARAGLAEMVHFVDQLQYYILFEVIGAGWEGLLTAIRRPDATLDTLISAHTAYLRSITRKGLLGGAGASSSIDFTAQLHELLKLMLAYRDAVDALYSHSVASFTRAQEVVARIETRTKAGTWGSTDADLSRARARSTPLGRSDGADSPFPPPLLPLSGDTSGAAGDAALLDHLRTRLSSLRQDFQARVNILLGDLAHQPDTDMRFLGVVMNFNDVYSPARKKRGAASGTGAGNVSSAQAGPGAGLGAGAATTGADAKARPRS